MHNYTIQSLHIKQIGIDISTKASLMCLLSGSHAFAYLLKILISLQPRAVLSEIHLSWA